MLKKSSSEEQQKALDQLEKFKESSEEERLALAKEIEEVAEFLSQFPSLAKKEWEAEKERYLSGLSDGPFPTDINGVIIEFALDPKEFVIKLLEPAANKLKRWDDEWIRRYDELSRQRDELGRWDDEWIRQRDEWIRQGDELERRCDEFKRLAKETPKSLLF